uniref:Ribonuclease P/MRP subunit p21 n=1 Tax=Ovis aries TaxID=9940 RepID=A0AC11DVE3_SHEEP
MAGPVKDREALQRLSFLYQGPLGEANSLPWLLFPPHPGSDLHPAAETLQGSALDCTDLPDMPAQPAVPQRPEACALGRPARGPAGEPGRLEVLQCRSG